MQKLNLVYLLLIVILLFNACANAPTDLTPTANSSKNKTPIAFPSSTATVAQAFPTNSATTTPLPVATATTAAPLPTFPPVEYQGSNPYRPEPEFDILYDPAIWSLVEDQTTGLGNRLVHRAIDDCYLRLQAGPLGAPSVAQVQLAGREWTVLQVQQKVLQYFFLYEDIGFMFDLVLPTEYSLTEKNPCQVQAEQVIDTFRIIEP